MRRAVLGGVMKRCADCRYFEHNGDGFPLCLRNVKNQENVVGVPLRDRDYEHCRLERKHGWLDARLLGACGKEGRFFSPRYIVEREEK